MAAISDLERLESEFTELLPVMGLLPDLSAADVERYAALGLLGRERYRAGEREAAARAFQAQAGLFPPNYEPWYYLALIAAEAGQRDEALDLLRQAVVRGFFDLHAIQRAEAWTRMGKSPRLLDLIDAVPRLQAIEREWPAWDAVAIDGEPPPNLAFMLADQTRLDLRLEALSPALGPRLLRLWHRVVERATAERIGHYILGRPDAGDREAALDHLLGLYSGGALGRFTRLPAAPAERVGRIADLLLARPRAEAEAGRPAALLASALAHNARRDADGRLEPDALEGLRSRLGELLSRHAGSPLAPTAAAGLVRAEAEAGRLEAAAAHYARFREGRATSDPALAQVRRDLATLALRLEGLPAFEATTLDGSTLRPGTLAGTVAVVDFWATWCGPCLEELPTLRRLGARHGDAVRLIGVNLDSQDEIDLPALREFIAAHEVPGSQIHDGQGWQSRLVSAFGVEQIPFTVVVGADGSVLAVNERGKRLEKTVAAALRKP